MKHLSAINLFLIIILGASLFYFQYYSNNQILDKISDLNSATNELGSRLTSVEEITGVLTEDVEESKKESSNLLNQVSDLKLKQTESFDELDRKISQVNVGEDFSSVVQDSINAVVSITTDQKYGSGVIVDKRGYIVTNEHVIRGISAAGVKTYDGKLYRIYVVGSDRNLDIAVLKMNGTFEHLSFGDSSKANVGEKVIALGSPGGYDFTVTEGIISAKRTLKGIDYVQTDVSINPGSSGGPLIDASGKIIGINKEKSADFDGIGFAIESNFISEYVYGLIDEDKNR